MTVTDFVPDESELTNAGIKRGRRRLLLSTFGHQCFFCSMALTLETVTVDHLVPKSRGGMPWYKNLVPACDGCNQKKIDTMPSIDQIVRASKIWRAVEIPDDLLQFLFPKFEREGPWIRKKRVLRKEYRKLLIEKPLLAA